jgi:2-oxoacid:acceptor oxidoreductase gamma subunit (pyruvate/2-ketoisovalerate family)
MELTIHGRDDQGTKLAGQILATAFRRSGKSVRLFVASDDDRDGPVTVFVGVDTPPIVRRDAIEPASFVLVLDPLLLDQVDPRSLADDAIVLVNSPAEPCSRMALASRIQAIDASSIATNVGLGPFVATAALGAFVRVTGILDLDELLPAIALWKPLRRGDHLRACETAYEAVEVPAAH